MTPKKYNVQWDCPHCGNSHNWWWEDKYEAFDDGVTDMVCDRCMEPSKCKGDGNGFYEPILESSDSAQRSLEAINLTLNELQTSRKTHLSTLNKLSSKTGDLESRVEDLEGLEYTLDQYCRTLEDKLNEKTKLIFDSINSLLTRLRAVENPNLESRVKDLEGLEEHMNTRLLKVEEKLESERFLDNLSRRMVTAELAIANLEQGVKAPAYSKPSKAPSVLDLIHGAKPPFHERLREECGFTKETLDGETIAKMLRFVAVEVDRMTERDMGGSFSVSNIQVAKQLRELADEAAVEDFVAPEEAW